MRAARPATSDVGSLARPSTPCRTTSSRCIAHVNPVGVKVVRDVKRRGEDDLTVCTHASCSASLSSRGVVLLDRGDPVVPGIPSMVYFVVWARANSLQ
jgi:hypothetical protein